MTHNQPLYLDDADEQEREALTEEPASETEATRLFYTEEGEFARRLGYT